MKIGLLLSGEKPYSEGVRSLALIGMALRALGVDILPLPVSCGPPALNALVGWLGELRALDGPDGLIAECRKEKPDVILTIDSLRHLQWAGRIKDECGASLGTYTSVFRGLHALLVSPEGNPSLSPVLRMQFQLPKLIPFALLTYRYRHILEQSDSIVGNSQYAAILSRDFYGTKPAAVVYPPSEPVFLSVTRDGSTRVSFLVFVGGKWDGDVRRVFPTVGMLLDHGHEVNAFGDAAKLHVMEENFRGRGAHCHYDISTTSLVRLYQKSAATLVTQAWEAFGSVGPESILCGTPVVSVGFQPWMELVGGPSPMVRVVGSWERVGAAMIEFAKTEVQDSRLRSRLADVLSPEHAARGWQNVLAK